MTPIFSVVGKEGGGGRQEEGRERRRGKGGEGGKVKKKGLKKGCGGEKRVEKWMVGGL